MQHLANREKMEYTWSILGNVCVREVYRLRQKINEVILVCV